MKDIYIIPSAKKIAVRDLVRIMFDEYPEQSLEGLREHLDIDGRKKPRSVRRDMVNSLRGKGLSIREIMPLVGLKSPSAVHYYLREENS
jgi:hypothetical protein